MTVKNLQLYKDNNKYYLSAVFGYEDKNGIYEISVPRIEFPISSKIEMDITKHDAYFQDTVTIDFGTFEMDVLPFDGKTKFFTITCLEEKVHEMTLAEIEKSLGYKIKLKEENKMKYKPYTKVIPNESGCLCAIYEPHPFRSSAISEAVGFHVDTGIADDEWAWMYYDWCCNPVGTSYEKPDGIEVDKFTIENLDFSWTTPECAQKLCDYLNMEPYGEEN